MNTIEMIYALGIAGAVLALARNIFIMILKIDDKGLMQQLVKLVEAGNVDRAVKLARAVERSYLGAGLIPALELFAKGGARRADLVQAYELGVAKKKPLLLMGRIVGGIGGALGIAGIAYAVMHADKVPSEVYAAPAIALFVAVGGEFMIKQISERADTAFGKLLEVLKDARG